MTPIELAHNLLAAFEAGDLAAVDELVHPAHRDHDARLRSGREGVRASITRLREVFADVEIVPEDLIAAGDRVVARVHFSGIRIGEPMRRVPTGRRLTVQQVHIWRVADGLLVEHWVVSDDLGALHELGAEEVVG